MTPMMSNIPEQDEIDAGVLEHWPEKAQSGLYVQSKNSTGK